MKKSPSKRTVKNLPNIGQTKPSITSHCKQTRIILTGASSVGKTTLIEPLASILNLAVIPELGRTICQAMGYQRIGEIPDQEGFKKAILHKQIEEEERLGNFISDRSTIDCWVLWQRWNICSAMTYETEGFYQLARVQSLKYTKIVYIPPMFAPYDDGFRWTDSDYQKQIDRLIKMTLYEWQLLDKTYEVKADNPHERLDEIQNWLKSS